MNLLYPFLIVSVSWCCLALPTASLSKDAAASEEFIEAEKQIVGPRPISKIETSTSAPELEEVATEAAEATTAGRKTVGRMPLVLMRASSGAEADGVSKGGRKSDADLHEFLKRRRQERILATTEADPLTSLKSKEEQVTLPENKSGSRSFGTSKSRFSGSSRKSETTTTTTTTTTAKPGRSSNGGGRFASSGLARKNGRGSNTTEASSIDKAEANTETSPKIKVPPKRSFKKN